MLNNLWQDLAHALRLLLRQRLVTGVVIATLGLGIGGISAVHSFINFMMFDALRVANPARFMLIWSAHRSEGGGRSLVSMPDFLDWRRDVQRLEQLNAVLPGTCALGADAQAATLACARVTPGFFPLLGVPAALGRTFGAEGPSAGAPPMVVLSHGAWRQRFGAAPSVVGRLVLVDGQMHVVAGVMPRGFAFPPGTQAWLPQAPDLGPFDRGERALMVVGSLRAGVQAAEAQAELATLARRLEQEHPATNGGWGVDVVSLRDESLDGQAKVVLALLGGVVGFVLLIACGNVAHMLLAQAAARRKEFALRAALGARPWRLAAQLLAESALLSILGGLVGLLIAALALGLLRTNFAGLLPVLDDVAMDGRVLAFTIVVALGSALLFGLMPALTAARPDLAHDLKDGGRGPAASRRGVRQLLVVGEVGLAVVLLVITGLMVRTLIAFEHVQLGFDPQRLLTFQLHAPEARYPEAAGAVAAYADVLHALAAVPGVESAAAASRLPLMGSKRNPNRAVVIEGQPVEALAGDRPWAVDVTVTPAYFRAIGIALRAGRVFTEDDTPQAQPVVVVSETMASRYWPGAQAVGQRLKLGAADGPAAWLTVAGVVADVRNDDVDAPPVPQVYLPLSQNPKRQMSVIVKSAGDPLATIARVRQAVATAGQEQAMRDLRTMDELVHADLESTRILVALLKVFAGLALALAAAGIYGVLSHAVSQRVHEIGIRMAVGARPGDVLKMIVRQSLALTLSGALLGLMAAAALGRALAAVFYQVDGWYPAVFAGSTALLTLVALVASLIPARRAARVHPVIALRGE